MSAARKLSRRVQRSETSIDLGIELAHGKRVRSTGKKVQKAQRKFIKAVAAARLISGLLVRATGTSAAPLVAVNEKIVDKYKASIAGRGTSISSPKVSQ
jgi:hypothetical protein